MGLEKSYVDYIEECARITGGLKGKRMLELGDQELGVGLGSQTTGKEYYESRGVKHTSFDLSGGRGSIRVDLGKPFRNPAWLNAFDIVTNAGTSEHVEPFSRQYVVFMNVHNCLVPGGIAVHFVPDVAELDQKGLWRGHCNYYYSHDFFDTLARLNASTVISSTLIGGLRAVCIRKESDVPFTTDEEAILSRIAIRKEYGTSVYAGINNHPFLRPIHQLLNPIYKATRPLRLKLGLSRSAVADLLSGRSRRD